MIGNNIFLASDDNWTKIVNINVDDFNIGEISYKIVEEIYLCFGIKPDKIPYISEIDGVKIIDESKLTLYSI